MADSLDGKRTASEAYRMSHKGSLIKLMSDSISMTSDYHYDPFCDSMNPGIGALNMMDFAKTVSCFYVKITQQFIEIYKQLEVTCNDR